MTKSTKTQTGRAIRRASLTAITLGALLAATSWADSNNNEVRLRTSLAGGAISSHVPSGKADFRSESNRNRARLNVEVEHVTLPDGTALVVSVSRAGASVMVGQIVLKAEGGELELNSQDGNMVPGVMKGDMVTVSNAGMAILTGVF